MCSNQRVTYLRTYFYQISDATLHQSAHDFNQARIRNKFPEFHQNLDAWFKDKAKTDLE
ncbi:hypothetical protein LguiA_008758 [Lonicera macranthoides]